MGSNALSSRRAALFALAGTGAMAAAAPAAFAGVRADDASLQRQIEALRLAMVGGDGPVLSSILHDHLNYMHSSGRSQTKPNLLSDLAGKQFFASLGFSEVVTEVTENLGIATMTVDQVKNIAGGRTRASQLRVMQTWIRLHGTWKLLARCSVLTRPAPVPSCSTSVTS